MTPSQKHRSMFHSLRKTFLYAISGLALSVHAQQAMHIGAGFIENKGQIAESADKIRHDIGFKVEQPGLNAYFKPDGIIYQAYRKEAKTKSDYSNKDWENFQRGDYAAIGEKVYFFRLDFQLLNANKTAVAEKGNEQEVKRNYYLPQCPNGLLNVPAYDEITYKEVYPNIDVRYYYHDGHLKYDFIVHPGGDPAQIRFRYAGAENTSVNGNELSVETIYQTITESRPYAYYQDGGEEVKNEFTVNKQGEVSFATAHYDPNRTLVIDPAITWATYYSNAYSSDFHCNSAFDSNGNIYSAFATYGGTWTTINAGSGQYYDAAKDGITDLVVLRFNANYSLQWVTYYGGDGGDYLCGTGGDYGKSLGVDASNNVYFGGYTNGSTVFPTLASGTGGAFYQNQSKLYGGDTPFLVKLDANGVRQWATLFQHEQANTNSAGMEINGICVSGSKVYFTGQTYKFNSNDVPLRTLAGAYNNSTFLGDQDPFIGRFDSNCILEWCTYFNSGTVGQKAYKMGSDITIDPSGNLIYVGQVSSGGSNTSAYLLNPGGGAYYNATLPGSYDLQVAKFNTSMVPVWSTYYGSADLDRISEVSTDPSGNILIACRTIGGAGMPTVNPGGAFYYSTKQSPGTWSSPGSQDGGIIKFSSSGVLTWATYVGGTNNNTSSITGIASDASGNIYAIGYTNTTNFPTMTQTGSYNQAASGGGMDMVFMGFTSGGVLNWSTYYGTPGGESCYGIKIKPSTVSNGCGYKQFNFFAASSGGTITTVDPGGGALYQSTPATSNSNACILFTAPSSSGNSTAASAANTTTTTLCSGNTATLSVSGGTLGTGANWQWYSGSCGGTAVGSGTAVAVSPSSSTTYYVRAEGTCNTTSCVSVTINSNTSSSAPTSINSSTATICAGGTVTLTVNGGSLGTAANWQWYSGSCGGTAVGSGSSITVSPASTTTYYVRAEGACGNTGCVSTAITVNSLSSAPTSIGSTTTTLCSGNSATLTVTGGSLGTGANWQWYTGSCGGTAAGSGSTLVVSPGAATTYYVRAEGSCNNTACASQAINVNSNSTAPASANTTTATLCSGGTATLSVSGGALGTGANWQWYSGSCGGTAVGSGSSITVSPSSTTTYYVRAEGTCGNTSCASTAITVNSTSSAPASIGSTTTTICSGNTTTLTVTGGSLGTGATWQWYTGSCGGTAAGSGSTLVVNPGAATTYYVRAEGSCGNTSCVSLAINVNNTSTAPASANTSTSSICSGGTATLTVSGGSLGTGANWQWYSGSCGGTSVGSGSSITVSPSSATTYYVRAEGTCGNTSCASTAITVNSTSSAPASIGSTTTTVCSGNTTTLTVTGGSLGTGATWQWYSGSCGGTSVGSGTSITVSPSSATTYYVRAEGSCGNTACASLAINVNSNSSAPTAVNSSTASICSAGSATLSVSGGALGTGANWQWYSGSCGGTSVGSGSSITVSPSSTTTYYVRAEGTCGNTTCSALTLTVNTSSSGPASISASSATVCSGSTTSLTVNGGSLGTGANWQWYSGSCGGTSVGSGSGITVNPSVATTYYVAAVGSCNTTSCASVNVGVNAVSTDPTAINPSASAICSGNSTTLTVSGGSLGTGANWQWYANGCGITPVGTGTAVVVSPGITTSYFVRAEGTCGNSNCAQVTVTVTATPSAAWNSPGTVCTGAGIVNLSALVTGNTGGAWSGTGVSGTNFDPSTLAGQTIAVTYSVANGSCSASSTQSISVASSVSANWNSPGSLCASSGTVDLTTYVTGSSGGTWSGSSVSGTIFDPTALSGPVAITYSVGSGSCSDSKTYTINVTPAAYATWTSPGVLCAASGTVDLNAYLSGTTGGTWTGTGVSGNTFDPSALAGQTILVSYQVGTAPCIVAQSHTIQVVNMSNAAFNLPASICENAASLNLNTIVTGNAGGTFSGTGVTSNSFNPAGLAGQSIVITYSVGTSPCGASLSHTVTVTAAPATPTVAVSNATICAGQSTTVTATGSGASAVYSVYAAPGAVNLVGTTPAALSPSATTVYYLQSVANGCSNLGGDVSFTVQVNPLPNANAGQDQTICLGDQATLIASGGGTYQWNTGATTNSITVAPVTNTSYTVTVTNASLCTAQDVVNVNVTISGSVQANDDNASVQSNQSVNVNVASNDVGDPNTVTLVSSPLHGVAVVSGGGVIVYTPANGYAGTDTVYYRICDVACTQICKNARLIINVTKEIVIVVPGGISPNGDGKNDFFDIKGLEYYPDNELVIFNRWGDEVFHAAPYKNDWDGQSQGKGMTLYGNQLVDGTYFYILTLDKDSKPLKGYVELKRK